MQTSDMKLTEHLVDELEKIAVATTGAMLAEGGFVPPPTMHMFCEDLGRRPYAGYVRARPFYPGDDAHTAVETFGRDASFVNASRLVLAWEQADLQIALQRPGELLPTGVVVADAPRVGEHVVRWNPAELVQTGIPAGGCPVVEASWGPARRLTAGRLPAPVAAALELWRSPRAWSAVEIAEAYLDMEDDGYHMAWPVRPDDELPQRWPLWRAVVEAIVTDPGQAGEHYELAVVVPGIAEQVVLEPEPELAVLVERRRLRCGVGVEEREDVGDIASKVDKAYEDKSIAELADAPVDALQGVSEGDAQHLKDAFNIKTVRVRDLGTNKYFLWAQAIAELAD